MSVSDDTSLKRNLRKICSLRHFTNTKQKAAIEAILKRKYRQHLHSLHYAFKVGLMKV